MHFGHPETLYYLVAASVAMALAFGLNARWRRKTLKKFGDHPMLERMADKTSRGRQLARVVCLALATLLIGFAAARPQWGLTNKPIKRTGVDIVFALDISKSMLARDASPNRLEAAKTEITQLLSALAGDRVGLVVFTAISFPQSPLTTDYGAIRFYLEKLDPAQMPVGGTSVGRAISDAVALLTGGEDTSMKRAKNQLVVLISDGEDHESAPLEAAESAAAAGVKIVTIGFGSSTGERIPLYKPDGSLMGYQRDRSGEIVRTRLDDKTLKAIADKTGGIFIPYAGKNSVARGVLEFIATLEKSELESLMKERYEDRFMWFLVPGFLLLVVGLSLGERSKAKTAAIATVLLLLGGCDNALRDTDSSVDKGNSLIEAQQFDDAITAFDRAAQKHKGAPEIAYDEGLAHLGAKRYDEAQRAFARALETPDPQLRLKVMFNLGVALALKESWAESYQAFQDAIIYADAHPNAANDRQLAMLQKNLEWVFHKLHPPCSELEDKFEENDTPDSATKPDKPNAFSAALCPDDNDWVSLDVPPGSRISIDAKFHDLRQSPDPDEAFIATSQDFMVDLVDTKLGKPIATATAGDLEAEIKSRSATRSLSKVLLQSEGPFAIQVRGTKEAKYDLDIRVIPPCQTLQEPGEPNDTPENATPLTNEPANGHLCPGDTDWYAYTIQPGDSLFIDVSPEKDIEREVPPHVTVELIDAETGTVVSQGVVEGQLITVGVRDVKKPGRYLVHVIPDDAVQQGPYAINPYHFAPCIAGDDRFEDNDDPGSATQVDAQQPSLRYLRICDNDVDFYSVPIDEKKKKLSVGLSLIAFPANPEDPQMLPSIHLDLMSADGADIQQRGARPAATEKGKAPMESALIVDPFAEKTAMLRVSGDSDFYHLEVIDGVQAQSDDNQSDKSDENKDQQKNDEQKQDQDGQNQPDDPHKEDQENQDQAGKDGADDQKKEGDQDEQQSQSGDEQGRKEEDQEAEQARNEEQEGADGHAQTAQEKAAEMQRIDDILNALEASDDNFQLRKALKEQPNRYIDKDW